jgi:ParB-like nuclease domain
VEKILPTHLPTTTRTSNDTQIADGPESEFLPPNDTVIERLIELPIVDITIDLGYQSRIATDEATVIQYTALVKEDYKFPPIHIVQDPHGQLILVDGHHRLRAYQNAGHKRIWARITVGTALDAVEFAATANTMQGLQLTNDDKRRSTRMLLSHPAYTLLSNRVIASRLNVSHKLVAAVRAQLENENVIAPVTARMTKGGRTQRPSTRLERATGESPSGEGGAGMLENAPSQVLDVSVSELVEPTFIQTTAPVGIMTTLRRGRFAGTLSIEVIWILDSMCVRCKFPDGLSTDRIELDEANPDAQLDRAIQALLAGTWS